MSLLLLLAGADQQAASVAFATDLIIALPPLAIRSQAVQPVPFLLDESGVVLTREDTMPMIDESQTAPAAIALPILKARKVGLMANWFEAPTISIPSTTAMAFSITVTDVSLSSPTVSASRAWDVTDPDNLAAANGILSGSASITTDLWTTPIITPTAADLHYRIETDVLSSTNTVTLIAYVRVPY